MVACHEALAAEIEVALETLDDDADNEDATLADH
jgi:hypothetical protein